VVPEEELPVAHEEVGVLVDEEAGVVRVEDGRVPVAVVVGREGLIEEGLLTSCLTQMVEIM
jgi:hypothetical protein